MLTQKSKLYIVYKDKRKEITESACVSLHIGTSYSRKAET